MIAAIINFINDIPKTITEILKFIPEFFKMVINIINILPDPFNQITILGIGLISLIYIVKVARGS